MPALPPLAHALDVDPAKRREEFSELSQHCATVIAGASALPPNSGINVMRVVELRSRAPGRRRQRGDMDVVGPSATSAEDAAKLLSAAVTRLPRGRGLDDASKASEPVRHLTFPPGTRPRPEFPANMLLSSKSLSWLLLVRQAWMVPLLFRPHTRAMHTDTRTRTLHAHTQTL